jgi:hypothetical protein
MVRLGSEPDELGWVVLEECGEREDRGGRSIGVPVEFRRALSSANPARL